VDHTHLGVDVNLQHPHVPDVYWAPDEQIHHSRVYV
jgi:hypothetical protein